MRLFRWIGPGAVTFLALWLFLLVSGQSKLLRDPGTFWHTATGELILREGFIQTDPYSFTFAGKPWVPYEWLGEVAMALVHRAGGFDAQLLGAVTLVAAVFAWLAVRLLRIGLRPFPVVILVAISFAAAASNLLVRPHLVTIAGLAVTAVWLADCDLGRCRLRRLAWLIPLNAVWANVHGGVLGGIGTVWIASASWVVFWRLGRPSPVQSWSDAGWLAAIGLGCGLAVLLNPYGLDLVRTWFLIMGEPAIKRIIQEHQPLDPLDPSAWPIFGLVAVYLLVLVGVPLRSLRVTWLLPLVWLLMAVDRVRHGPLFAVMTLVAIAAMFTSTRWAGWLGRNRPEYYRPPGNEPRRPLWTNLWLPILAVSIALALQVFRVSVPVIGAGWARHDSDHWPIELLDVLKEHEPRPPAGNRLFNDLIDGGFAIYHVPGYKVFVDDRCELYGGAWLTEFVAADANVRPAIAKWEARYGRFDFALTRTGTPFDDYFRAAPSWELVKRTDTATFYKRRG